MKKLNLKSAADFIKSAFAVLLVVSLLFLMVRCVYHADFNQPPLSAKLSETKHNIDVLNAQEAQALKDDDIDGYQAIVKLNNNEKEWYIKLKHDEMDGRE